MKQKQVILAYLHQKYPQWILGGLLNRVDVVIDGQVYNTAFRGDRNARALTAEKKIDKTYNDKGLVMYRAKMTQGNLL